MATAIRPPIDRTAALPSGRAAHAGATRAGIDQVAASLQDLLGQRLTAVIAGIADARAVGSWARGERKPHPKADERLRHAYQIARLLAESESPQTVRAWFVGMNPDLDDHPPALVVAEDPVRVLQAARAFLAHG